MLDILLSTTLLSQSVGPGYVGRPSAPFYVCLNKPGPNSYVNVRSAPTTRAKSINRLYHGTPLYLNDRRPGPDDGMWWAKVTTIKGQVGFVRDDYVCVNSD